MYGLYGLKHHTVEMLPCGTDGRTNDKRQTREDKATQRLDAGRLSFAIFVCEKIEWEKHNYLTTSFLPGPAVE